MASQPYETHLQHLHFIRKTVTYADQGAVGAESSAIVIGQVPAGSIILKSLSGVQATTVFNNSTTAIVDIGTSSSTSLYGTALDAGSTLFVSLDESVNTYVSSDTEIQVILDGTLAAATATAGSIEVVISYITNKQSPVS